jgi:hypothetical protein
VCVYVYVHTHEHIHIQVLALRRAFRSLPFSSYLYMDLDAWFSEAGARNIPLDEVNAVVTFVTMNVYALSATSRWDELSTMICICTHLGTFVYVHI